MITILIILTGGTIGSERKKNIVNISKKNYLRKFLLLNTDKKINYKIIRPLNILSENALPTDWNIIIRSIEKNWKNNFSGIIITHGTDTLAFAASAFSQYFHNFNKPVVLVSSDKPLKEKNSTGKDNLMSAISFIYKQKLPGTYVAYKNPKEKYVSFFLGSRIKQINNFNNKLNSITGTEFCKFKKKKFIYTKKSINPTILSIKKNGNIENLNIKIKFSNKILVIFPYPGLNYDNYNINKIKPKAILHGLYHSGTASTRKNSKINSSLQKFIKQNKSKKIPFYIAPLSSKNKNIYESLKNLLNAGVKYLDGISFETAYAKLSLVYKSFKNDKEIRQFLKKDNFFEKITF